ncbi:MAG: winged helix-turn-helix domain-containing protein [Elusimicrobiota bacterium]
MLEFVFGNKTVEKILLYLERYGEGYPMKIAQDFNIRVNGVQQQLKRLETGGVVASRLYGNVRLYKFNPRYPLLNELRALLNKTFDFLPEKEIRQYYMQRTRPRRAGKPI